MAELRVSKKHHKHVNNPFPSTPNCLPFIRGRLSFNPCTLLRDRSFCIGDDFQLFWSTKNGGHLSISHRSQSSRSIWSTVPGEAFVSAAAVQTHAEESRGSFAIHDGDAHFICKHQTLEEIRVVYEADFQTKANDFNALFGFPNSSNKGTPELVEKSQFPILMITGRVFSEKKYSIAKKNMGKKSFKFGCSRKPSLVARYWFLLEQKGKNQIGFRLKFSEFDKKCRPSIMYKASIKISRWKLIRTRRLWLTCTSSNKGFVALSSHDEREGEKGTTTEFNKVFVTHASDKHERFYGFGEQFSGVEFKGKRVPILVQEQGIGRGDQPITFAANLVSYRSGGDWSTTYAPSPFYITSRMKSLYLEGYNYSVFDLTKLDRVQIQVHGNCAQGRILNGNSPVELIELYTETIGRPPLLPNWIISGAVVGMQGGTEAVRRAWDQLQEYDVPVSAFWLQDWVGKRETIVGSQLWWNWEVDESHYVGWRVLIDDLRAHDVRVMAYCNPCLVQTDEKPNKKRDLFEEAKRLDILVRDKAGRTYMVPNTAFDVGMLDFTHPAASSWFKKILHEMVDTGIRGWMADFGEGLPLDAYLYSDEDPIQAHNRYPELWARVNKEFVDEWKSNSSIEGRDPEESLVFFMRAGFRGNPKWTMLFWEGDQMVSWQANDGIKSSVTGLLSSGISGFAFNHSDTGGYCAVDMPFIRYRRSEELLMRWMELNAFSVVFRTHEGNKPASNCQFYDNKNTLSQFARCAKIYKAWKFYRIQLVKEAAERGMPVARHLFLHYPDDKHVQSLTYQQFLVGTEIMVAPVLDKAKKDVKVYFPAAGGCSWQHIWTGKIFFTRPFDHPGHVQGYEARVDAPIGYPAVFVKCGSRIGEEFLSNLRALKIL